MPHWTLNDMPSQAGRLAVVTGANGGLGYETALGLAQAGAEVVLAGRNAGKGEEAVRNIARQSPLARLRFELLDLASLASVKGFSQRLLAVGKPLDLLVNNAGVMALPRRATTADGFEMQLGTNYLGHFALTAQLLPLLRKAGKPRVVNLASIAHKRGRIALDDLQSERAYVPWRAYGQSKLAMLMFSFELQRRSDAAGWGIASIAAHPGFARTELIAKGPVAHGGSGLQWRVAEALSHLVGHSAAAGALSTLYAATSPDAQAGGYYGPQGLADLKGPPGPAHIARQAKDLAVAAKLWDASETLVGKFQP